MRPPTRRTRTGAASIAVCCLLAVADAQQTRDGRRRPATGTSSVTGVVLLDDDVSVPLRRARVTLNGGELSVGRTIITNDDGTFAIQGLPAGRYTVGVVKDGYVPMNYGARRPNRPGTAIALRDGETRTVTLRMPRGSVITGTILDAEGQPASGILVDAMRFRFVPAAGQRRMTSAGRSATDDRGVYRIYGLAAGEYFVVAHPRSGPQQQGDLQIVSPAEVRRALAEVRQAATRRQPGTPTPDVSPAPAVVEPRRSVALVPVFYPGTVDSANATTVTVGRGEARGGVDFQMQYVSTATVSGVVAPGSTAGPASVALTSTRDSGAVSIMRNATVDRDGRFAFMAIEPGNYTVFAQLRPGGWAKTEIVVNGEDVSGVSLTLQPGLTIAGRIAFEGATPPPPDLTQVRLSLPPIVGTGTQMIRLPPVQMQPGARFTISGIVPGVYRFGGTLQGVRAPIGVWWLKSLTMGGRELLDAPLDLQRSASDVIVTFSDRATELTGTVRDAEGNPLPDRFVVVFGAEKATWFANSRRVAADRLGAEGRYTIRNLPPGDYLIAVSEDLEQNEWFDPAVLENLAGGALRIVLREYEHKQQDWIVPVAVRR